MRRLTSVFFLLASSANVGACRERAAEVRADPAPPMRTPAPAVEGLLVHTCAPWDGAAYALVVGPGVSCATQTVSDGLRVILYRELPKAPGTKGSWKLGTNVDNGSASRFVGGKAVEELIGSVSLEHTADGRWSAEWALSGGSSGPRVEQRLNLTECPGRPMCG